MPVRHAARATLAAGFVLGTPLFLQAWGFTGHRLVNGKAVSTLPAPLRPLFENNRDYLAEHAIDPDLWRAAGAPGEDPNHFLDMDAFGADPFPEIPREEAQHLARHGQEAREKGRVPWRVGELYRELVAAFRHGDEARVLERAAVLAHYVGDSHVPLHAVLNYDGQLSGQQGIHNRWESALVERQVAQLERELRPAAARPPGDPVAATFAVLLDSFRHAAGVLASDRASTEGRDLAETPADDRYDDAYYSRLHEREGERVRARLSAAVSAVGSLWLQAWEEAGRPEMDTGFRIPYVRGRSRAALLTLDAASASLIDDAARRGLMPHLAKLRRRGSTARGSLTTLPAKTAAGHAALFTGAWPDVNGIAGNEVAVPGEPVTVTGIGFSSTFLRAEPIWVTAARQGLRATVASATQVFPFTPYVQERRFGGDFGRSLTLFDGYHNLEAEDRAVTAEDVSPRPPGEWLGPLPARAGEAREFRLADLGVAIDGLLYDDPADPVRGFDTLYLALDRDAQGGVTLKPEPPRGDAEAFRSLAITLGGSQASLFFRLFELSPDGRRLLLYRAAPHVLRASKPEVERAAQAATGGFLGNGAEWLYQDGGLGPRLSDGGDGTAEARLLESMALVARQLTRLNDFAWDRTDWHLLVTYLPYPDGVLHAWRGLLDPALPGHDRDLAAKLGPWLDRALTLIDGYVGHLAARAGEDVILAVGADHGVVPTRNVLKPNLALARAGLLGLDAGGRVDLARTQVYYSGGQFLLLNRASRPGGIVRPDEERAVRQRAREAMLAVRDPRTRQAVVLDVRDAGSGDPATGGPHGGDMYLSVAPGYDVWDSLRGEPVEPREPRGEHGLDPDRPAMHASFTVAGPGVAAGVDLGLIRQIDIAPTLCALLGLDPPAQASGQVLTKALAHPLPASPRQ